MQISEFHTITSKETFMKYQYTGVSTVATKNTSTILRTFEL